MKRSALTLTSILCISIGAFAQVTETPVKEAPKTTTKPVKGELEQAPSGNTGVVLDESKPVKGSVKEQEMNSGKPVKGEVIQPDKGNTGVIIESDKPVKEPVKISTGTKDGKIDAPIVTDKNHTPDKLPTGNRISGDDGNKEGKKKGPSQDKIEHAEEKSNGHAFSGKGKGAVKGSKEPEPKSKGNGHDKGNDKGHGKKK